MLSAVKQGITMEGLRKPYLIHFNSFGDSQEGYLTVAQPQKNGMPFEIKRVFWSYYTPQMITRGRHAHYKLELVLVAVTGKIIVTNENTKGETTIHILDDPSVGLYIPPMFWHVMQFSHNAVLMCLASTPYDENDYVMDYQQFIELK